MCRKSLSLFLAVVLCAFCCPLSSARAVSTSAHASILMDADTGRVLYAQNETETCSIASVTKLMTALVAAEAAKDLDETVTVDPAAVGVEGSSIYLAAGEQIPLRHLLYGLLLQSGNDAAVAIAIHCAGDVESFAEKMNAKARALGMTRSHFENPNGLESESHYSCAYDLALLAQAVLAHPVLSEIAATRSITLGTRTFVNHNKLLWRYEGCVGLKTGYTKKAGRTLVSAARRGSTTLIAVTLNDGNDWADHAALFDYGFGAYRCHLLARAGKSLGFVRVAGSLIPAVEAVTASDARWCLAQAEQPTAHLELPRALSAPVAAGDTIGSLVFYLDGNEIARTDLIAAASAPYSGRR